LNQDYPPNVTSINEIVVETICNSMMNPNEQIGVCAAIIVSKIIGYYDSEIGFTIYFLFTKMKIWEIFAKQLCFNYMNPFINSVNYALFSIIDEEDIFLIIETSLFYLQLFENSDKSVEIILGIKTLLKNLNNFILYSEETRNFLIHIHFLNHFVHFLNNTFPILFSEILIVCINLVVFFDLECLIFDNFSFLHSICNENKIQLTLLTNKFISKLTKKIFKTYSIIPDLMIDFLGLILKEGPFHSKKKVLIAILKYALTDSLALSSIPSFLLPFTDCIIGSFEIDSPIIHSLLIKILVKIHYISTSYNQLLKECGLLNSLNSIVENCEDLSNADIESLIMLFDIFDVPIGI
jgi:hypothetical protein